MEVEDIKLILSKYRNIMPRTDREKKMLIDLLINSVVVQPDEAIDVYYNFREGAHKLKAPPKCSTTCTGWSTKLLVTPEKSGVFQ